MKTNSIIALILSISLFGLFGCADKYEVDYEAPVKIEFTGVDQNNRVSLEKGVAEYTATVKVQVSRCRSVKMMGGVQAPPSVLTTNNCASGI